MTMLDGIELGKAYVFLWLGAELSGVAYRQNKGFVTLRTKNQAFVVPLRDVLREVS